MICRTPEEMKAASADPEVRVRSLEEWKAEHVGVEKKMTVWAGAALFWLLNLRFNEAYLYRLSLTFILFPYV